MSKTFIIEWRNRPVDYTLASNIETSEPSQFLTVENANSERPDVRFNQKVLRTLDVGPFGYCIEFVYTNEGGVRDYHFKNGHLTLVNHISGELKSRIPSVIRDVE